MILGRDFTQKLGLDILNSDWKFRWAGIEFDMVSTGHCSGDSKNRRKNVRKFREVQETNEVRKILESKYEEANLEELVASLTYLNRDQQFELLLVMNEHKPMFAGKVGQWKGPPINIQLKDNFKPRHAKAYRVPHAYLQVFKKEIERLVEIGTLSPVIQSEWASPTFFIPKRMTLFESCQISGSSMQASGEAYGQLLTFRRYSTVFMYC